MVFPLPEWFHEEVIPTLAVLFSVILKQQFHESVVSKV
jgi:hypothetical protein